MFIDTTSFLLFQHEASQKFEDELKKKKKSKQRVINWAEMHELCMVLASITEPCLSINLISQHQAAKLLVFVLDGL